MQIAPPSSMLGAPAPPAPEIPGWKPAQVAPVPAHRRTGRIVSLIDALRGVRELGNGQPLSAVQMDTLTPALAAAYELPETTVRDDLEHVRLYTGGAALGPGWATTVGRDIYVHGEPELQHILEWSGRRWLAHELGHVMQWRRIPGEPADELGRIRRDALNYAAGAVTSAPRGVATWVRQHLRPRPGERPQSLPKTLHDVHPMEIEAERHARAFAGLPPIG